MGTMSETVRVDPDPQDPVEGEDAATQALRLENAQLLRELENAYAQLTAILQVSQDETRIAYSELQEKIVVLEKKLFEVDLMSDVGGSLTAETRLEPLRRAIVDKICLAVPVDLAALHLETDLSCGTHRERDMVFDTWVEGELLDKIQRTRNALQDRPQPVIVADLEQESKLAHLRLRSDARSAVAIPLRADRFLGLLLLNSRLPSNFRQDQEPLLATYAMQAAIALHNAQRIRKLENALIHVLRQQKLPIACVEEGFRIELEDDRTDRIQQEVRRLAAGD